MKVTFEFTITVNEFDEELTKKATREAGHLAMQIMGGYEISAESYISEESYDEGFVINQ